ncbi:MAG TPA: hypothetical protein VIZ17_07565 [Acetobacteraceae bacterium]
MDNSFVTADTISVNLIAVLVAVTEGDPRVLTVADASALPSGPLELGHGSLQAGLRAWVERQTHHPLGYVEQLYTFADRDRAGLTGQRVIGQRVISISYLGLTRERPAEAASHPRWQSWYDMFPWEDWRAGLPPLHEAIGVRLAAWAAGASGKIREARWQRAAITFGLDRVPWNEELILQRYELLYEAGLVPEAPDCADPVPGRSMMSDHRRILATGIARLRAKIKYRPVVFELMPDSFTLLQLQRCVEAIAGLRLHKQNFRRLIEQQELVEETGASANSGGRPAKLFRFRREVLAERAVVGTKLPLSRA